MTIGLIEMPLTNARATPVAEFAIRCAVANDHGAPTSRLSTSCTGQRASSQNGNPPLVAGL